MFNRTIPQLRKFNISNWRAAQEFRDHLTKCLEASAFKATQIFEAQTACDEAISNAILHGSGGLVGKPVHVSYFVDAEKLWIRVQDQGAGFDITKVPDPRLPENVDRPHGRGLFLMNFYMDKVQHGVPANVVTMVKLCSSKKFSRMKPMCRP